MKPFVFVFTRPLLNFFLPRSMCGAFRSASRGRVDWVEWLKGWSRLVIMDVALANGMVKNVSNVVVVLLK